MSIHAQRRLDHELALLAEFRPGATFSEVAGRRGIAHTTVSRRIRELEAHYGTALVERVGERMVLTAAGIRAADAAERIDAELLALERGISAHDDRLAGRIRITTVDLLAARYMPLFSDFTARHPDIELSVSTATDVRNLSLREAEVAIRLTNSPPSQLFGNVVERIEFFAYAAADAAAPDDLATLRWLDYEGEACDGRADAWMRQHAPGARPSAFLSTPLMMMDAVRCGLGAGMLPEVAALQANGLQRLSRSPAFSMEVWILAPEELRRTARVRALFAQFRPREVARLRMNG